MSDAIKTSGDPGPSSSDATETRDSGSDSAESVLQAVLARPRGQSADRRKGETPINGVVIGDLAGLDDSGRPTVTYPGMQSEGPQVAVAAAQIGQEDIGRRVALSFEAGDPARPVILGLIHETAPEEQAHSGGQVRAVVDDERLTLTAQKEIVLQCGKSSITLTRAGKIIIKGAYLSNHSTGVNRIKGGSVQIN